MAQYKVPQDVEAEDKLIGWLSFRQLIYAGIAAGSAAITFFGFSVFPPLIIVTLPITVIFGILTLPLRKDQPLETYLLAVIRFYLKPKFRKWDPDGVNNYVDIVTPVQEQHSLAKEYGPEGAQERLDYLAKIMDSRGWAYKQADGAPATTNLTADAAAEATTAVDVLDDRTSVSQSFKNLIQNQDRERQNVMSRIKQQVSTAAPVRPSNISTEPGTVPGDQGVAHPTFNPYPASMHQKVILPGGVKPVKSVSKASSTTMPPPVSPAIIRLATNSDNLTVSAIANEAKRLEGKEVVIKIH